MGRPAPKAFLELAGRPIVEHSLAVFDAHPDVDRIILMVPAALVAEATRAASRYRKVEEILPGGRRRQDTVKLGLEHLSRTIGEPAAEDHLVLVHDAARPLVDASLIRAIVEAAASTGAAFPGLTPTDTVRQISQDHEPGARRIGGTLDRRDLVLAQTPQGFRLGLLLHAASIAGDEEVTDDVAWVQRLGHPVEIVTGSPHNLKITTAEDLEIAEAIIVARRGRSRGAAE